MFGFDLLSGFKFYLNSGFVEEVKNFEVLEVGPDTAKLISIDGRVSKTISLKENDYELFIEDRWVGEIPADIPTPYIATGRMENLLMLGIIFLKIALTPGWLLTLPQSLMQIQG